MIGLLKDIASKRPAGRLLGIDVGKKTLGLAVSDGGHIATPLKTIQRTKFTKDVEELAKIVKDYDITGFILGLPLNMDGTEGPRCQSVRDFAIEMERYFKTLSLTAVPSFPLPSGRGIKGEGPWIALWDERLSTASVEDFVDNTVGINQSKAKAQGLTDKLAAQYILQVALDFIA